MLYHKSYCRLYLVEKKTIVVFGAIKLYLLVNCNNFKMDGNRNYKLTKIILLLKKSFISPPVYDKTDNTPFVKIVIQSHQNDRPSNNLDIFLFVVLAINSDNISSLMVMVI